MTVFSDSDRLCVDAQQNLKSGDAMGLWVGKSEQADQSRSAQQKTSSESTGGRTRQREQRERGQPNLAEGVQESFSASYVGFLKNWFLVSTKFLADDDVVAEATESDAAVRWSVAEEAAEVVHFIQLEPVENRTAEKIVDMLVAQLHGDIDGVIQLIPRERMSEMLVPQLHGDIDEVTWLIPREHFPSAPWNRSWTCPVHSFTRTLLR